ncbi:MAG: hypothetical protein ACFE8E_08550 [Candidatus Hodarchaeota archaeon]
MISWILGVFLILWCIGKRITQGGKVEGQPLTLPKGTVRAIITLMIVSFPFTYIINDYLFGDQTIPSIITNAIFILIAFYFEARKGGEDKLKLVEEIQDPEKFRQEKEKQIYPLYLPKYTVRISLVLILILVIIINIYGPNVTIESVTNTLLDILIIIVLYFIGILFRTIGLTRQKKRLKKRINQITNYQELSKYQILEKLEEKKPSHWLNIGKSLLSILTFIAVVIALFSFTFGWEYIILSLPFYTLSIQDVLLLVINVYYGFRE